MKSMTYCVKYLNANRNKSNSDFSLLLKPDGMLFLSGFNESNEDLVVSAIEKNGLKLIDRNSLRGWLSLMIKF